MPIPSGSVLPLLDEVKEHVNVTSETHDIELQDLLDAAVQVVEGYVGPLDARTVTETHYNLRPGLPILLREYPVLSVTSVVEAGGTPFDADGYTVDLAIGRVYLGRPTGGLSGWAFWGLSWSGDVTVTYSAGRADLPAAVRTAILIVAARLWETQRGNAPSALPISDDSGFDADPGGLPLLPPRARELLRPYLLSPSVA